MAMNSTVCTSNYTVFNCLKCLTAFHTEYNTVATEQTDIIDMY